RPRGSARGRAGAAAERAHGRQPHRPQEAARVGGSGRGLLRRRRPAGNRPHAARELRRGRRTRGGRAPRGARRRGRAGRDAARLPPSLPPRGPHVAAQRALPRADRHRPGRRQGCWSDRGGHYSPRVARRRRQAHELERVLGANALFATAYGNVGSSIYYALGLTAGIALGLTPIVFIISGVIFAATAATYAEGTVRYPEAGGSSSFARHAFNELVSFGAAWAQMLNYVITVAISVIFVPHYLSIFWEPLRTNPWDIILGIGFTWLLVGLNIVGVQEAAKLNILLAVVDFATQLLLVVIGFVLIFSPSVLWHNVSFGVA